jgi:AsmA family protein
VEINVDGSIGEIFSLDDIDLQIKASGRNLAEVGPMIKQSLPETGPFTLSGRLTGSTKALALQDARGKASHRSLNLTLNGGVKDLLALSGLNLNVRCSGGELSDIGPWAGVNLPELGRFDVRSHLTGSAMLLELDGLSALVDQSDLNGSARVEFRKRPKITAILESALLDLTPLMKVEKAEEIKVAEKIGRDRGLFSDEPLPFNKLEAVDIDITLNARNIRSRDARWEFGHLVIKLEEGDLRVERLEAAYKGTKVSGTALFQAGSPSCAEAKFLVQDFNLGAFLREVQISEKVKGRLDIAADVSSRGNSVKTLLGKLSGTAVVVMGKGYLSKYLDWLAQDLTRKVIPFWGDQEKAGVIDCAVIQFDIKNGLATSQAFVLNSPVSVLTGEGTVNLETEKVNFLLSPSPKQPSLFSLATNLQVTGTIQNPEVRPNLASLALKLSVLSR